MGKGNLPSNKYFDKRRKDAKRITAEKKKQYRNEREINPIFDLAQDMVEMQISVGGPDWYIEGANKRIIDAYFGVAKDILNIRKNAKKEGPTETELNRKVTRKLLINGMADGQENKIWKEKMNAALINGGYAIKEQISAFANLKKKSDGTTYWELKEAQKAKPRGMGPRRPDSSEGVRELRLSEETERLLGLKKRPLVALSRNAPKESEKLKTPSDAKSASLKTTHADKETKSPIKKTKSPSKKTKGDRQKPKAGSEAGAADKAGHAARLSSRPRPASNPTYAETPPAFYNNIDVVFEEEGAPEAGSDSGAAAPMSSDDEALSSDDEELRRPAKGDRRKPKAGSEAGAAAPMSSDDEALSSDDEELRRPAKAPIKELRPAKGDRRKPKAGSEAGSIYYHTENRGHPERKRSAAAIGDAAGPATPVKRQLLDSELQSSLPPGLSRLQRPQGSKRDAAESHSPGSSPPPKRKIKKNSTLSIETKKAYNNHIRNAKNYKKNRQLFFAYSAYNQALEIVKDSPEHEETNWRLRKKIGELEKLIRKTDPTLARSIGLN